MNGGRLQSLDALRGFDMLFIMGVTGLLTGLLTACGLPSGWLETQFTHAVWHGLRFEDTIFPLFLFLAGVTWPLAMAKRRARGCSTASLVRKTLTRGLSLALLGFVYNGVLKFDFANMVWGAVLTRIGVAWAIAALLAVFLDTRKLVAVSVVTLLGYWAVCVFVAAPDAAGSDPLSVQGCFAGWVDRQWMPGKLTQPGLISNQGLLSTVPAVVTALLGVLAGRLLQRPDLTGERKAAWIAIGAIGLATAGVIVAFGCGRYSMPFNKILWSSSFVLAVGGYSAGMLALFYWLIDVKGWWRHTLFFRVIGMNSITIYMANKIMGFGVFAKFFFGGLAALLPAVWGGVLLSAATIGFEWLFLYFLYRKNVFLRV